MVSTNISINTTVLNIDKIFLFEQLEGSVDPFWRIMWLKTVVTILEIQLKHRMDKLHLQKLQ